MYNDVKAMPLSNNTISRKIYGMGKYIQKQLVEKLKTRNFSVQVDKLTLRDIEAVLILISCAADGAPNMMGKKNSCLKFMKDANPEIILVHCVIHRENLVAKNISPVINNALYSVIKSIPSIQAIL
ncbi:protein ZBED8-like [Diabrotica virgifera virgifera]|uniref:SCAN domain-containing protein 3-like n=1 Tax=Diabrotica virgifera virgifera TaxID=50390 RepID=A0ABM5KD66_DIAVI|nr:protein ZBED8-like [Diabrotica virgifera virgifera]